MTSQLVSACSFFAFFVLLAGSAQAQGSWKDVEKLCAASHYVCTQVDASQLVDPAQHQMICMDCFLEYCHSSSGCDKWWCPTNASGGDEPGDIGCLYSGVGRSYPDKYTNWNAETKACVAAHAACKHMPFGYWLRSTACSQCVMRCRIPSCNHPWCASNADSCE